MSMEYSLRFTKTFVACLILGLLLTIVCAAFYGVATKDEFSFRTGKSKNKTFKIDDQVALKLQDFSDSASKLVFSFIPILVAYIVGLVGVFIKNRLVVRIFQFLYTVSIIIQSIRLAILSIISGAILILNISSMPESAIDLLILGTMVDVIHNIFSHWIMASSGYGIGFGAAQSKGVKGLFEGHVANSKPRYMGQP